MKMAGALALGLFVTVAAGSAHAQSPQPGSGDTWDESYSGSTTATAGSVPEPDTQRLHKLFSIGGMPAYLYTPVEPPYNAAMNRNLAADPIWEPGY
jgi:hypothetical protein